MGILGRVSNMFKAKVNSKLDDLENPIELLDQKIKDMEEQLNKAKLNAAQVLGNAKAIEKKLLEEYRLKEEAEEKKSKSEQEEIELVKRLKTTTQIQQNRKLFYINVYSR